MRNIVYIATYKRTGSGVLLGCDLNFGFDRKKDEKSYLILTNYHVIQDIDQSIENQKRFIKFKIKDINGEFIDSQHISYVSVKSGNNYNMSSDIAAILVIIKACCKIKCSNKIYIGSKEDRVIATQGYPHVFQNNLINQELCLTGKVEKYNKQGLGVYKILDDYHGYSDISDKELMDGISGAPVYTSEDGKEYLIGINQSLCNIGDGKNPFKIIYFLEIGRVLEWLRSQEIILFEYKNKHVKLLWMKSVDREEIQDSIEEKDNKEVRLLNLEKNKRIVLIGGSGAGKSSFLKTMCQNGELFGTVGDGQTTRATVAYHLQMNCKEPSIFIKFSNMAKFVEERMDDCDLRLKEFFLCNYYGMDKKDIDSNPLVYLQDIMSPLRYMSQHENNSSCEQVFKEISDTIYICQEANDIVDYKDRILKAYDSVLRFLKLFFNDKEKGMIRKEKYLRHGYFSKKAADNYIQDNKKSNALDFFVDFFKKWNAMDEIENHEDSDIEENLKNVIEKKEGIFNISEFFYLNLKEDMGEFCELLFKKMFYVNGRFFTDWNVLEEEDEEKERENRINIKKRIGNFYVDFYKEVERLLQEKGINLSKGIQCKIQYASNEEKKLITRCLRKVGDDSLSSIVSTVVIEDAISNDYAFGLHERKIHGLDIYDTCGIDHIERGNHEIYIRSLLNDIKGNSRGKDEKGKKGKPIDAIIYVKKLDSEKPTELETMLPIINGIEQACPIFCLFTAADQFLYGREHYMSQLVWDREHYENWKKDKEYQEFWFPKVIENMHESTSFVDQLDAPNLVKQKISNFVLDHMFPFACEYDINQDQIIQLNRKSIVSIMMSILVDEWNIGFIPKTQKDDIDIDSDVREEHINSIDRELKDAVEEDLEKMFRRASQCDWGYRHHSTILANFKRIYRYNDKYNKEHKELGFNRTLINRWDNLLEQGFSESFLSRKGKTLQILNEKFGLSVEKAYALMATVKNEVITDEMGIWHVKEGQESEFRTLFRRMYENENIYPVNVFEKQTQEPTENYGRNQQKIEFLNKHCDFGIGLEGSASIKHSLVEYLYKEIREMLEENNKIYFNSLLKYDLKFNESLEYVERVMKKYANGKLGEDEKQTSVDVWKIIAENYGGIDV